MKARKVKGLDPAGPLFENAARIVAVRLDELVSFAAEVRDPQAVTALHDMRIAAKRLRYVLELTTPLFGPEVKQAAKEAKRLQDLLGEIHDCDEMLPLVERQLERLRAEDAVVVRAHAGENAAELDPALVKAAPHRRDYRGLASLRTYLAARRTLLYERFMREWAELVHEGFHDRLLAGLVARTD